MNNIEVATDDYNRLTIYNGIDKITVDKQRFMKHFSDLEHCVDLINNNPQPSMKFGYYGVKMEVRHDEDGCPEVVISKGSESQLKLDFIEFDYLRKIIRTTVKDNVHDEVN